MMTRPDNQFSVINIATGTEVAAGASLVGTVIDTSQYEGNMLYNVVLAAGTGTLNVILQHGTTSSVFATIGTDALFTPATGAVLSSGSLSVSNASTGTYTIAVNVDKTYRYHRILANSAAAVPAVSIVAIAPNKYANWQ